MSSSQRPDRTVAPHRWVNRWSLRTQLLAGIMALLLLVCVIVASVITYSLHRTLVQQVDDKLRNSLAHEYGGPSNNQPRRPGGPPNPDEFLMSGKEIGTLSVGIRRGETQVVAKVIGDDYQVQTVPGPTVAKLLALPRDGRERTVDLGGELGNYRIKAITTPDGEMAITGIPMAGVENLVGWMVVLEVVVTLAALLIVGFAGYLILSGALRPLRRMAATASRVAELPLDRGEVALSVRVPESDTDPRTEVGQVGAALNRMLGHVAGALTARQASETRVRQFVADASHELRTPLAAIRGYAELTRRHREPVPDDVLHAMRRVESEAGRMTTLVEDLLLLARLDSGRPLTREPVDLSRLLVDAVSDAHVAGPQHHWQLDLPEEAVTVVGDEARLHQIFANLLTNARVHTPPGTTVEIGLRAADAGGSDGLGTVSVIVADDGPGIPVALQPEVFERFARGDTSRSRAAGSTGLGLAIVAAVVEAHQGLVEVESAPGRTAFTVRLPAGTADAPAAVRAMSLI